MATRRREDFDSVEAAAQTRARVLIADASKIMRLAVSKILEDEYELVEAVSASEAWDLLQSVRVNAVMMSLNLPDLKAYGLLERIRDARPTRLRQLPVAIIAEDSTEERERAKNAGADTFIPKPFDSGQLKKATHALLVSANRKPSESARERTERESTMVDPPHRPAEPQLLLLPRTQGAVVRAASRQGPGRDLHPDGQHGYADQRLRSPGGQAAAAQAIQVHRHRGAGGGHGRAGRCATLRRYRTDHQRVRVPRK